MTHNSQTYTMLHRWHSRNDKAFLATSKKVKAKDVIEDKTGRYLVDEILKTENYQFAQPGTKHYTLSISRLL